MCLDSRAHPGDRGRWREVPASSAAIRGIRRAVAEDGATLAERCPRRWSSCGGTRRLLATFASAGRSPRCGGDPRLERRARIRQCSTRYRVGHPFAQRQPGPTEHRRESTMARRESRYPGQSRDVGSPRLQAFGRRCAANPDDGDFAFRWWRRPDYRPRRRPAAGLRGDVTGSGTARPHRGRWFAARAGTARRVDDQYRGPRGAPPRCLLHAGTDGILAGYRTLGGSMPGDTCGSFVSKA